MKELVMPATKISSLLTALGALLFSAGALAQEWKPVTGAENIRALFSETTQTATLPSGGKAVANYNADGTGNLQAWGEVFERRWEVKNDNQVCIEIGSETRCFTIEVDASSPASHRATNVATGETIEFDVSGREVTISAPVADAAGSASQPSAEEIAAKLANPNSPMATLTFRLQYRQFAGDLPGASSQDGSTIAFQPSFPFTLDNGDVFFFRPNIPIQLSSPIPTGVPGEFADESGLGDIGFDLAYGRTTKSGMIYAGGVAALLPTASEDALGADRYALGPEFLVGKLSKKYVLGIFPSHVWDVGGSGDADINLTTITAFATYLPGGGWNVGSSPIMTYDHTADQWNIPLNVSVGKTVIWNERPWKLSVEFNYFVEKSDSFGQEWFIGFNIAPVVENVMAKWFQ
jgi:hypothetical protein